MPGLRRAACALSILCALLAAPASAEDGPAGPGTSPCEDPLLALRCPNLRMDPPSDLHVQRAGHVLRLLATNHIVNNGAGPLELRATRTSDPRYAKASQVIYDRRGRPVYFPEAGYVYWKAIPGQGHYWKYFRAARFELWTVNPDGSRAAMIRTGPKLSYCLRDLDRVAGYARSPRRAVYPACSQDHARRELRLGVSPGWADVYPWHYHENWISITGLRGCFAFVHRADPTGELIEEREDDNAAQRMIRLPPRHGSVAPRGCPSGR
ncbi:hypothetical protein FSW04_08530 [Baekduia soli]|uniref:Uncharacterized protein n=1 Tax=Baekduia soli TaxID=496014 RepID=A0A5B8U404_9ACTN|nr:lysyl oxidase family protein [Baekduia soli]QEC47615.1 hypothetical protein FSW04_08530 [Baekduia soli]